MVGAVVPAVVGGASVDDAARQLIAERMAEEDDDPALGKALRGRGTYGRRSRDVLTLGNTKRASVSCSPLTRADDAHRNRRVGGCGFSRHPARSEHNGRAHHSRQVADSMASVAGSPANWSLMLG